MALTATIYPFSVQLADVDRGVYVDLDLRLACHPSETIEFMLTRLLAYCLEYEEGISFTDGIGAGDEPSVVVRDLTGRITAWIEIGAPDAERLHRGIKLAGRAAVYTHRDPAPLLAQLAGKKIYRGDQIPIYSFGRGFLEAAARTVERRSKLVLSITERQIYLDLNGHALSTALEERRLASTV
jgi:uncharacterized protein YaeQ